MAKPCGRSSRWVTFRIPPDFGVWLVAGIASAPATRPSAARTAATRWCVIDDLPWGVAIGAQSLRENACSDNGGASGARASSPEEAQQEVDGVEEAAREAAHHGAVDPDELEIVAGVLLDQAHGALGPEGEDALFDELRQPAVVALDRFERAGLRPAVDLAPEGGVVRERVPGAVEALGHPRDHVRALAGQVGHERPVERGRRVLEHAHGAGRREQLALGRLHPGGERGLRAEPLGQGRRRLAQAFPDRVRRIVGDLPEPGVEGGDDALAVDQAEQARYAKPEARIGTHPLAGTREP